MLKTIEDSIYTYDIYKESVSKKKVGTKEFAEAVIKNLGQHPSILKHVNYDKNTALIIPIYQRKEAKNKTLVGIDVFVHWRGNNPDELAEIIKQLNSTDAELTMITNRELKFGRKVLKKLSAPTAGLAVLKYHILQYRRH